MLSVRGCEWVVCDHGRGVLPPLPMNSAPPGCAERGGSSSPSRLLSGEVLHPLVTADVGVSHVPRCLCQALGRVGTLLLPPLQPGSFWVLGAGFFPLVLQALGRGEKDLGPLPFPGLGGESGESMETSRWHTGCWVEDGAECTSSGRCAHTTRITPANPVTDLTYIWGKGGSTSVAADGVLKSLGSGRLWFCRPLALAARWLWSRRVQPEQPLQLSKAAAAWHGGSCSPGVSQVSVAGVGTACPGPGALASAAVHGQPCCSIGRVSLGLLARPFQGRAPRLGTM